MKPKNTIYSEIMCRKYRILESERFVFNEILNAHVFFIDNVAEYYYQISEQEYWDEKDFPNIAPPLNTMWFEWNIPQFINMHGKITNIPVKMKFALLIKAFKKENNGWKFICHPFISRNNLENLERRNVIIIDNISKDGSCINMTHQIITNITNKEQQQFEIDSSLLWINPVFLALSFIHCRNIQIIPKGKGVHHEERDRNAPSFRYHILQIEPMKRVLEKSAEKNKTNIKMALHICRGHFKDYRNGNGLFGRIKDVFWWDQQLRGDFSLGYVDKDYISPTKEERL